MYVWIQPHTPTDAASIDAWKALEHFSESDVPGHVAINRG